MRVKLLCAVACVLPSLLGLWACGAAEPAQHPLDQPSDPRVGATSAATSVSRDAPPPPPEVASSAPTPQPPAPASADKLNVIVISIDAFRADHAPWLGYEREVAPRLHELAKHSTSYTHAYSLSSYTAMSMGGFLGGRYPGELQRNGSFFSEHPDSEVMFPELLQQAGVRTVAAHAHFYFDKKAGFRQGFDVYSMVPGIQEDATTDKSVTSPQHSQLAIDLLSRPETNQRQFFAWFHFMDPHDRYKKHDGYTQFGRGGGVGRYDGEIFFTDAHIGKLLDFVAGQAWGQRTAIIVTADHGEAFGEHKMTRHGFELWQPLIRVPLLIHLPDGAARTIDEPRSHIDLAPTIFDLLGLPAPAVLPGKSLLAEARGMAKPEPRDVIIDLPRTSYNWRRRALVHGHHKIIAFGDDFRFELYDIDADPLESVDLRLSDKPLFDSMKARYLEHVKSIHDVCPSKTDKLKGKAANKPC